MMATAAEARHHERWSMTRVVIASSTGTAFEWYDFFIFGSLAPVIGKVFFSALDPTPALIAALGLFAAGFAFRPLGALIFGIVGDRMGRKGAFLVTVSLMGGATFLIGLLPTYGQVGVLAPALLILLRILQGIALGGEYGGAAIYVAEHSADDNRGTATGWIQSTASFGLLAAMLIIFVSRTWMGEAAFGDWGWRIPFLVSVLLLGVSLWMRLKLTESPEFSRLVAEGNVTKAPLREAFAEGENLKRVLIAFFGIMLAQGAVWYFTFFYMQVFLEKSLGMPASMKDLLLVLMTVVSAPLYVFFGWWSDRIGRKPIIVGGMALALHPLFPRLALDRQGGEPGARARAADDAGRGRDRPGELLGAIRPGRNRQVHQRLRHRQERAHQPRHFLQHPHVAGRADSGAGRRRTRFRLAAARGFPAPASRSSRRPAARALARRFRRAAIRPAPTRRR